MRSSTHFRKLNRDSAHRRALLRNMVTSLIKHEAITTTVAKAKELRRVADRMITVAKRGTLAARRQALGYVQEREAVEKLFAQLAPRFTSRPGGYTRLQRLGNRKGDGAPLARIEYLQDDQEAKQATQVTTSKQ